MNAEKKAHELCIKPLIENHDMDIDAMTINLEMGEPYGLDVKYESDVYVITRYGQDVFECGDFTQLVNMTWAIVHFLDIPNQPN